MADLADLAFVVYCLLQLRMRLKDSAAMPPPDACSHQAADKAMSSETALAAEAAGDRMTGLQSVPSAANKSKGVQAAASPLALVADGSSAAAHAAAPPQSSTSRPSNSSTALQQVVAEHLGLMPVEEGRQMLHYVIPQALAPQLQVLLELLDWPEKQQQLGLAEVHVSLASLEEVFLAVVKQVGVADWGCPKAGVFLLVCCSRSPGNVKHNVQDVHCGLLRQCYVKSSTVCD